MRYSEAIWLARPSLLWSVSVLFPSLRASAAIDVAVPLLSSHSFSCSSRICFI